MGRSIYLTEKEIRALTSTATVWCEIMAEGAEESCEVVENALNNGLGSALKKLYKGRNGYESYKDY